MARRKERAVDDLLPDERCPPHLVDRLVEVGFRREDVEKWQGVKARAVLEKFRRDTSAAVSRADGVAQQNDGTTYPPPQAERDEAAGWLAATMAQADEGDMRLAMTHAIYQLAGDEAMRLASHLLQRLKIRPKLPESTSLFGRTVQPRAAEPQPVDEGFDL